MIENKAEQDQEKKIILWIVTLTSFLTPFMASGANIALPLIGRELSLHAVLLSWTALIYTLSAVVFLLPFGRLADMIGRKKIFSWGLFFLGLGSMLVAWSHSAAMILAARVVQGFGGGMMFGTGTAMLTAVYPPGERGRALGWNVAAVYLGLSLGPPLGGGLIALMGWRSIFWLTAAFCFSVLLLILWRLKSDHRQPQDERFDWAGAILYGTGIIGLMMGFSRLSAPGGRLLLAGGTMLLLLFLYWDMRVPSPLLNVALLRSNRIFAFSNLAAFINYSATFAVGFLLSLYLQAIKGFSPQYAGLLLVPQPIVQAIFSPLTGHFSDRIEPRKLASAGMASSVVGLLLLTLLTTGTSLIYFIISQIFLGLGFGLFSSPNTNAVMSSVEKRSYGVASATLATMRLLGQMFSMGTATLVIALLIGHKPITIEQQVPFLSAMHWLFTFFAVLSVAGIFASLARGRLHSHQR